jgi:hypothetical protein
MIAVNTCTFGPRLGCRELESEVAVLALLTVMEVTGVDVLGVTLPALGLEV